MTTWQEYATVALAMNVIGTAKTAELLGQSERTTLRQVEHGGIPTVGKIGGYLFDEDVIVRIRDERIAAKRAELDAMEAAS